MIFKLSLLLLIAALYSAQELSKVEDWIYFVGKLERPGRFSCPQNRACERTISGSILLPNNFKPVGADVEIKYDRRFNIHTNVSAYGLGDEVGFVLVHYLQTIRAGYADDTHGYYNITASVFEYDEDLSVVTYIIKVRWMNSLPGTFHYGFVFRMTLIEEEPICNLTCTPKKVDRRTGSEMCECCPPVCLIFCQYGNVMDEWGCPTCKCKSAPNATLVLYDDELRLGAGNYLFTGNGPNRAASIDLKSTDGPHSGTNAIKIRLDRAYPGPGDQFTIYLFGNGNASGFTGISLVDYNALQLWVKTNKPLNISTNFGGGATDSGFKNFGDLLITTEWTFFEFDISLSNKQVINTIFWAVLGKHQNPGLVFEDITLWLDDIKLTGSFSTGVSTCDYTSGYYTLRDASRCSSIDFHCNNELVEFNNDCGCGCKPIGYDL